MYHDCIAVMFSAILSFEISRCIFLSGFERSFPLDRLENGVSFLAF